MTADSKIILFHAPQTRSSGTLALLEELKAPYELKLLNMKMGEQRRPPYLAVNPMGKVPAILNGDSLVTEQVAIFIYLADLFPEAGLAPGLAEADRGPYLRWLVYYAACYEPAMIDRAMDRPMAPQAMSPFSGDLDAVLDPVVDQLSKHSWLLGERFSAADMLWGSALGWGLAFKIVPENPILVRYAARVADRESQKKVVAMDAAWAAEHQEAADRATVK